MIFVTSSNWINCSFSRPSLVRMSFCQIAAKFFFFKFKICQTVARHKYDQSISQKIFYCLSLTNYLFSKLQMPYIGVISAIVHFSNFRPTEAYFWRIVEIKLFLFLCKYSWNRRAHWLNCVLNRKVRKQKFQFSSKKH